MSELKIPVRVPGGSEYTVRIGTGLIERGSLIREVCPAHRYALIADRTVADLYAQRVLRAIEATGAAIDLFTFPAGEESKTRESWIELSDRMLEREMGRDSAVLALGGGVTGDLAGFVAATFLRGIPLVQLPTSLLAMLDSSVGGKTGVDTPAGKNLIGAFHQPRVVLASIDTLSTLPAEQVRSGLAEAVKHGAIADTAYFSWIRENVDRLISIEADAMAHLVARSVEIKAAVVGADEREAGLRKSLNFGHTIGHAIEALSGFRLLHGEAIAIGTVLEARIGEALSVTHAGAAAELEDLLRRIGLPTSVPPGLSAREILEATRIDKKARGGRVEYALIERIGSISPGTGSYGTPVPEEVAIEELRRAGAD